MANKMKSIIFNQHQVNHALKNKEGMFRVVVKLKKNLRTKARITTFSCCDGAAYFPFEVGETIFVKESFVDNSDKNYCCESGLVKIPPFYKADNKYYYDEPQWKPAQHMKQEHSRLILRIKSVKVEKLQDISEEDCWKECGEVSTTNINNYFRNLWNSTHKKPEEKWEANPFCFVYEYEVIKNN